MALFQAVLHIYKQEERGSSREEQRGRERERENQRMSMRIDLCLEFL